MERKYYEYDLINLERWSTPCGDYQLSSDTKHRISAQAKKEILVTQHEYKYYPFIIVFDYNYKKKKFKVYEFFSHTNLLPDEIGWNATFPGYPAYIALTGYIYQSPISSSVALEKVEPYLNDLSKASAAFERFFNTLRIEYQAEQEKIRQEKLREQQAKENNNKNATELLNTYLDKQGHTRITGIKKWFKKF